MYSQGTAIRATRTGAEGEYLRQLAADLDPQAAILGMQGDRLDKAAHQFAGFRGIVAVQSLAQRSDLLLVDLCNCRVQPRDDLGWLRQFQPKLGLTLFGRHQAGAHRGHRGAVADRIDEAANLLFHPAELGLQALGRRRPVRGAAVPLLDESAGELLIHLGLHQPGAQAIQNHGFQRVTSDRRLVRAHRRTLVAGGRAAEAGLADLAEAAATAAAPHQAGEQVPRALLLPGCSGSTVGVRLACGPAELVLALAYSLPEVVIDDRQVRDGDALDVCSAIEARAPFVGIRILDVAQPVPDEATGIQLVVENAGAARAVAVNGGGRPGAPSRRRNSLFVQLDGDRLRRLAGCIFGKNPADDLGLCVVDLSLAGRHAAVRVKPADHLVTIRIPAGAEACLNPAEQSSMGLVGQVVEEHGVHRALEPDMQGADGAFADRDELHAHVVQPLEKMGNVLLVARKPVEGLCHDDVQAAALRCLQHVLVAGPSG